MWLVRYGRVICHFQSVCVTIPAKLGHKIALGHTRTWCTEPKVENGCRDVFKLVRCPGTRCEEEHVCGLRNLNNTPYTPFVKPDPGRDNWDRADLGPHSPQDPVDRLA
jgi:hypothetical protein